MSEKPSKKIDKKDPAHKALSLCIWHRHLIEKKCEKIFSHVKAGTTQKQLLQLCEYYTSEVRKMSAELTSNVYNQIAAAKAAAEVEPNKN